MNKFTEQISSGDAVVRIDVIGGEKRDRLVQDDAFLNYRLGVVGVSHESTKAKPDIIWYIEKSPKAIVFKDDQLILDGDWNEGELNKIMVSMLAMEMDNIGVHPFHSSCVRYKDKTILLLGSETNHGKSMSQLEGCNRGGLLISTETTVTDGEGVALYGSKNIWSPKKRAKGTERSDLPSQDEGVNIFFEKEPEMPQFNDPSNIDLVIMPSIDGWFKTEVIPMEQFERCFHTYHSLSNFFGLSQCLTPDGHVMPIIDTDEKRQARGMFVSKFAAGRPYFMIRSKTPQILFDEIDKLL